MTYSDEQEIMDEEKRYDKKQFDSDAEYERRRDMSPDERDCTWQARSWGI